jgi:DNA-binding beta-propeller fold protein YncE
MMISSSNGYALTTCAVAVVLASCGGSQAPIAPPGAMPQTAAIASHADRGKSWMLPEAKNEDLLYISFEGAAVNVYSYSTDRLVGQITGFGDVAGLCSDKDGNVFATDTFSRIVYEFAHGGTQPIAKLYSGTNDFGPFGCAVDPTTNNLAVTNADSYEIFIFANESGTPSLYSNPYAYGQFCTYDDAGNLFTRGTTSHVAELPKGSSTFQNLKLNEKNLKDLVGFAWDGKYLSVNNNINNGHRDINVNYRIHVANQKATIVRKTRLRGAEFVFQFTIYNNQLIGPDEQASKVSFWKYPIVGAPVKTIAVAAPLGSAISVAR